MSNSVASRVSLMCCGKMYHWTIAVFCIYLFCGSIPRISSAEDIVDVSKKAINEVNNAMSSYDQVLNVLPVKKLKNAIANLDRRKDEYSAAAGGMITEIKDLMTKGVDAYSNASRSIYDWSRTARENLKSYIKLFDDITASNIQKQKDLLVEMMEEGIQKMNSAQKELGESSTSFNGAAGKLVALKGQFSSDFDSNSAYFKDQMKKKRWEGYGAAAIFGPIAWAIAAGIVEGKLIPDLNEKLKTMGNFYADIDKIVAAAAVGIEKTKTQLQNEIGIIGNLKVATEETNTFVSIDYVADLRDTIVESANTLIKTCSDYIKRYEHVIFTRRSPIPTIAPFKFDIPILG